MKKLCFGLLAVFMVGCASVPTTKIICTPIGSGYENKSYLDDRLIETWTNSNDFVNEVMYEN